MSYKFICILSQQVYVFRPHIIAEQENYINSKNYGGMAMVFREWTNVTSPGDLWEK